MDAPSSPRQPSSQQLTRGQWVRAVRKKAKLTQEDVARLMTERMGTRCSRNWVIALEKDRINSGGETVARMSALADILGVSAVEFLEDERSRLLSAEMPLVLLLHEARTAGIESISTGRGFVTSDLADVVLALADAIRAARQHVEDAARAGTPRTRRGVIVRTPQDT
ncbi:helix-turn-helix domain-containing protein [Amycolatopsis sp. GM8]|uniref:helix-turn-helix domain-containing protein n=1 Tax=Amycolatopsis sp. GM8 TaxID=2896530 RepID=UPI001F1F8AD6|nr:helix-turn-helix transcriptional regulator [Amycolatopsis sp. GM8]